MASRLWFGDSLAYRIVIVMFVQEEVQELTLYLVVKERWQGQQWLCHFCFGQQPSM